MKLAALLAGAFALTALAADPPPRPVVLKAARLFDGKADKVTAPGVVVIVDGKIQAVGPGAATPPDAEVIDLGDATLLPGLMDAHTHLSFQSSPDWKQDEIDWLEKPITEQALIATEYVRKTLYAGFTTCRDLGSEDLLDVGLRNAIRAGKIPGPRMLVAVNSIGATGGHCDTTGIRPGLLLKAQGDGVADGPDAIRALVRRNIKYGADVIKTCATGGVLSVTDDVDTPQLTQAELDALVDEAHALRRKVAAHAHGAAGARRAIKAGVDSVEHCTFLDDETLDLMKTRGTYYVPTLMALEGLREKVDSGGLHPLVVPKARAALAQGQKTFRRAVAKGVKIAFGTDAAVYPHGRNAEEFRHLVELGMKPAAAIRAATSVNAELLGISDRLGSLEAGKIADVIAVPGDPLQDIRQVERVFFVMKDGRVEKHDKAPSGAVSTGH